MRGAPALPMLRRRLAFEICEAIDRGRATADRHRLLGWLAGRRRSTPGPHDFENPDARGPDRLRLAVRERASPRALGLSVLAPSLQPGYPLERESAPQRRPDAISRCSRRRRGLRRRAHSGRSGRAYHVSRMVIPFRVRKAVGDEELVVVAKVSVLDDHVVNRRPKPLDRLLGRQNGIHVAAALGTPSGLASWRTTILFTALHAFSLRARRSTTRL